MVDVVYEISNGMTGLQRNIFLCLCNLLWYGCKDEGIRMVVGMCEQHYHWKNHSLFLKVKPNNIPTVICDPRDICELTQTPAGIHCAFKKMKSGTVFLEKVVKLGVFHWSVKVEYSKSYSSDFAMGVTHSDCRGRVSIFGDSLGDINGSCALQFGASGCYVCWGESGTGMETERESCAEGDRREKYFCLETNCVSHNSLIGAEVDTVANLLSFFVDGRKMLHAVSAVDFSPLLFGMSGNNGSPAFTSLSFRRLPSATQSPVICVYHKCNPMLATKAN